LAGANLIYGLGMLEMGITFGFGQLVIDSEIARMIKFTLTGIPVNDSSLAVDAIGSVGIGKHFLDHDTTFAQMRSQSRPDIIDRNMREEWAANGATDMYQRACQKALHILENHQPDPLPAEVGAQLDEIIRRAEADRGVTSATTKG
jgi:trimethylamine---corrinoid protein Co-methyltransferase